MTMPTHAQTAAALDQTIATMEAHPELDADLAARLAVHGSTDWVMPYGDTADSLLYEAVIEAIEYEHEPDCDGGDRDPAQTIPRDTALHCARDGAARYRTYR